MNQMNASERSRQQAPDILVHAGFHKTGTSSLQSFLALNAQALSSEFRYFGKADFPGVGARARRFGQRPFPWRLWHFRAGLRSFLADLPDEGRIVLSRETFSGILPGHRRLFSRALDYGPTAVPLAEALVHELRHRFGHRKRIALLYTLRRSEDWQKSVYGHLLRSIRITDDLEEFRLRLPAPDLQAEARSVAEALAPVPVYPVWLEEYSEHPEGPAKALLDIMGVPTALRTDLRPFGRANTGHNAEVLQELLHLNRTIRDKRRLVAAKEAVLKSEIATRNVRS